MKRRSIQVALGSALLALLLALLAWRSYTTTLQRTYGEIPPFVLEMNVVDAAGQPVPQPTVRLLDATTRDVVDDQFFSIEPRADNATGQVEVHFRGEEFEAEDWRLFWLFRRVISASRDFNKYQVQISATGHDGALIALPELLREQAGTVPLPDDRTQQIARYVAQVVLP